MPNFIHSRIVFMSPYGSKEQKKSKCLFIFIFEFKGMWVKNMCLCALTVAQGLLHHICGMPLAGSHFLFGNVITLSSEEAVQDVWCMWVHIEEQNWLYFHSPHTCALVLGLTNIKEEGKEKLFSQWNYNKKCWMGNYNKKIKAPLFKTHLKQGWNRLGNKHFGVGVEITEIILFPPKKILGKSTHSVVR